MNIHIISTRFLFKIFTNCYLVEDQGNFIMIDTGMPNRRNDIENQMVHAGCRKDNLKLLLITHGDKDHLGNAAYFRTKFGVPIAMHREDAGMAETGSMFSGRKTPNAVMKWMSDKAMGLSEDDRFQPDIYQEDGDSLKDYGIDATIVHMPGHSSGSIGVLTPDGKLFSGDLFGNLSKPALWSIIDDPDEARASIEKLKKMEITTLYPGHGSPFKFKELLDNLESKS